MGYSEDEQELNIPELEKIDIKDLHVFFLSYWEIGTAILNKRSGLPCFLIDTVFIYLLALHLRQTSAVLFILERRKQNAEKGGGFNNAV